MSLDNFFLTAPFATDELKRQVEEIKNKLQILQADILSANMELTDVVADLTKMEEKTEFLEQEIRKALVVSTIPEETELDKTYQTLTTEVYDPLNFVSTTAFAVSGLFLTVGFIGSRGMSTVKAGQTVGKTLGAARSGKNISKLSKLSKVSKASKFSKFMKVGNKLGAVGLGLVAVELGLKIKNAAKLNDYFKQNISQIKTYIAKDSKTLALLKQTTNEAKALRTELLEQAGLNPIDNDSITTYIRQMNEDIASVGRDNANLNSARRMLSNGMDIELIEQFIPELSVTALSMLAKKMQVEHALLNGDTVEDVTKATGLTVFQVKRLQKLINARQALLEGQTIEQITISYQLLEDVVEGIEETLFTDRRTAWALIAGNKSVEIIAQRTFFTVNTITYFKHIIDCKLMIDAGKSDKDISTQLNIDNQLISDCRSILPEQKEQALEILNKNKLQPVKIRPAHIAADLLLPSEIVIELEESI